MILNPFCATAATLADEIHTLICQFIVSQRALCHKTGLHDGGIVPERHIMCKHHLLPNYSPLASSVHRGMGSLRERIQRLLERFSL